MGELYDVSIPKAGRLGLCISTSLILWRSQSSLRRTQATSSALLSHSARGPFFQRRESTWRGSQRVQCRMGETWFDSVHAFIQKNYLSEMLGKSIESHNQDRAGAKNVSANSHGWTSQCKVKSVNRDPLLRSAYCSALVKSDMLDGP